MSDDTFPILLAQCKAYHSIDEITQEIETLLKVTSIKDFNTFISLPYSYIEPISKKFSENGCTFGAENLLDSDERSFTASIAGKMLSEANAKFVLIGTPEDRSSHSGSTNHLKTKVRAALAHKIQPIICVADSLHEHQEKTGKQTLITQIKGALEGLSSEELKNIYLAYNAEWISRTPWEANSPELHEAYTIFREAVDEAVGPDSLEPRQIIAALPGYSEEVPQIIAMLKSLSPPFLGYSLGILSSSAEYLKPLK